MPADDRRIAAVDRRIALPGLVLGLGLGGFLDGIVLHQLLEWHHLLSSRVAPTPGHGMRVNTVADGVFHLGCFALVVSGVVLLTRLRPAGDRRLLGAVVAGWGVFNVVEGTVFHLVLGLHHVRPGPHRLAYDLAFLVLGVGLALAGWLLASRREGHPARA